MIESEPQLRGHEPILTDYLLAFATACVVVVGRWGVQRIVDPDHFGALITNVYFVRTIGDFLWEIRTWVLVGAGLVIAFLDRWEANRPTLRICAILYCLFAYLIITALWSPTGEDTWPKILDVISLMLTLYLISVGARSEHYFRFLVFSLFIFLWPLAILSLVAVASGSLALLSGTVEDDVTRLSVLAGGSNTLGRLLGTLVLISCHRALAGGGRSETALHIAAMVAIGILLILTGSRGAALGTMIGLSLLFFSQRKSPLFLALSGGIAIVVVAFAGFITVQENLLEIVEDRWISQTFEDRYDSERGILFRTAVELWFDHPIFGSGLESFVAFSPTTDRYAHNLFLEILHEGGLVAFSLLLLAAYFAVRYVRPWRNNYSALSMALLALWGIAANFSGELYDSRNVFIFAVLAVAASVLPAVARDRTDAQSLAPADVSSRNVASLG